MRRHYSAATRRALLDAAATEFAAHGYAATSLDVVVGGAQVTKGALYHHFAGKQALFEGVFARVEADAAVRIRAAMEEGDDPWEQARNALRAFLAVVQEPAYQRVVLQDGPAVLGHERFREQEQRTSRALVREVAESLLVASSEGGDPTMVDTVSHLLFGAVSAAGEQVAGSADPRAETERVERAIGVILDGLRQQAAAAPRTTDPAGT